MPLEDLETMLNFIRTTKTQKGLRVRASQIKGHYPTGIRVTASAMANVNSIAHNVLPAWNYSIVPGTYKNVKLFLRDP